MLFLQFTLVFSFFVSYDFLSFSTMLQWRSFSISDFLQLSYTLLLHCLLGCCFYSFFTLIHCALYFSFIVLCVLHTNRICHECEGRIEKPIPRIAVWHPEACRGMTNGDLEGRIVLYYTPTRIMDSFSCSPLFLFIYLF